VKKTFPPWFDRARLAIGLGIAFSVVLMPIVIAASSSPWVAEGDRLERLGAAYGGASIAISSLALFGVVASLRMQREQTRASQLQASRMMRMELLTTARAEPELLGVWGYGSEGGEVPSRRAYVSMVFTYLYTAFDMGVMSERDLRSQVPPMFQDASVVDFWNWARLAYRIGSVTSREMLFAVLVDEIYEEVALSRSDPAAHP
jgi:hypothetical protein